MIEKRRIKSIYEKKVSELLGPYVATAICSSMVLMIDSVFAGSFIGAEALAALGLLGPVLFLDECLHGLLVSATVRNCANIRVKQGKEKSAEYFGAVLIAVAGVYFIVCFALLVFAGDIIGFFTHDEELYRMTLDYYYPIVLAMPLFELLLCTEFAYAIDGKAKLLSLRPVIASISNILLDMLFVVVLDMEMTGVAVATICSTLLGYSVLLIHRFSGKCTVHPDFSVIRSGKRFFGYIRMAMDFGKEFAILNLAGVFSTSIVNRILLSVGGVTALSVWTVVSGVMKIFDSIAYSIGRSFNLVSGILLGSGDCGQFHGVLRKTVISTIRIGVIVAGTFYIFAKPFCMLFGAQHDVIADYVWGLRISMICAAFYLLSQFAGIYFVSIHRMAGSRLVYASMSCFSLLTMYMVGSQYGLNGCIAGYFGINIAVIAALVIMYSKDKIMPNFEEGGRQLFTTGFRNDPESITDASRQVGDVLTANGFSKAVAFKAALIAEESCMMIGIENMFDKNILIYIRLCEEDGKLLMTLSDNGMTFDLVKDIEENKKSEWHFTEEDIIGDFADEIEYDRILELNCLQFTLRAEKEYVDMSYQILVDPDNPVDENFAERFNFVAAADIYGNRSMVEEKTFEAYQDLYNELLAQGIEIGIVSAYRSFKDQEKIIALTNEEKGSEYVERKVASPGTSEHHTGLALDITVKLDGEWAFGKKTTSEEIETFGKIHRLMSEYGFILRYPEGNRLAYDYEPWHIRYVGKEAARYIRDKGILLEDYCAMRKKIAALYDIN